MIIDGWDDTLDRIKPIPPTITTRISPADRPPCGG